MTWNGIPFLVALGLWKKKRRKCRCALFLLRGRLVWSCTSADTDTHTPSPKLTTQQCLPWALAGNHYSIRFVLSGNSRATQTGPAVLTFLMMAPSSGRAAWTTRSDPGTCEKGGSCSSTTSRRRCLASSYPESVRWCVVCACACACACHPLPPFTPPQ